MYGKDRAGLAGLFLFIATPQDREKLDQTLSTINIAQQPNHVSRSFSSFEWWNGVWWLNEALSLRFSWYSLHTRTSRVPQG